MEDVFSWATKQVKSTDTNLMTVNAQKIFADTFSRNTMPICVVPKHSAKRNQVLLIIYFWFVHIQERNTATHLYINYAIYEFRVYTSSSQQPCAPLNFSSFFYFFYVKVTVRVVRRKESSNWYPSKLNFFLCKDSNDIWLVKPGEYPPLIGQFGFNTLGTVSFDLPSVIPTMARTFMVTVSITNGGMRVDTPVGLWI